MEKKIIDEVGNNNSNQQYDLRRLIQGNLYKHQMEAAEFACEQFGLISGHVISPGVAYFMEMGTGKTRSAIAVIGAMTERKRIQHVLIVMPKSVIGGWENEMKQAANFKYSVTRLDGGSKACIELLESIEEHHGLQIVLVNYDKINALKDWLIEFDADLVIADEGHKIKNRKAKRSITMHQIGNKAKFRMLLTGTPITNHEIDVFSEYLFLNSSIFGDDYYNFCKHYFIPGGYKWHPDYLNPCLADEFKEKVLSITYRAKLKDCVDLPDMIEKEYPVILEPSVQKKYYAMQKRLSHGLDRKNITGSITQLTFLTGGFEKEGGNIRKVSNAKFQAVRDIVDSVISENKKLVICGCYNCELDEIQNILNGMNIEYSVLRGETKNRDDEIKRFQEEENCRVLIGQISVAGLGINLTAASTIIFYSLNYSYENLVQAKARIHRIGQTEKANVIYLVCRNTIDGKILNALKNKRDVAEYLLEDYQKGGNPFVSE